MGKKFFSMEDIPQEVWWVQAIRVHGIPIGIDTWNRAQEIIKKYPDHFQWEHQYMSIPDEVHEAHNRECYPERYSKEDWMPSYLPQGKGMSELINREPIKYTPLTMEEMISYFKEMEARDRIYEKKQKAESERKMAIWKKHYGKYNLSYRE